MSKSTIPRRSFLEGTTLGIGAVTLGGCGQQEVLHPEVGKSGLRKGFGERIEAGREAILAELKPTSSQIRRGLDLHYTSFVAEVQGNVPINSPQSWIGERLQKDLDKTRRDLEEQDLGEAEVNQRLADMRRSMKTFESAFDPQWRRECRGLYQLTGVDLGVEDVAHPFENDLQAALRHTAWSNFAYEKIDEVVRVSGIEDIDRARQQGKPSTILHLAGVGAFAESENPIEKLDLFHALGVRMSQLTYVQKNALCCSWIQEKDTGLTSLGKQVVRRMNELGMMVDLAHSGHQSALDIIEVSSEPVLISHAGCSKIYDVSSDPQYVDDLLANQYARGVERPAKTGTRNFDDEVLGWLAKRGGIVAIYTLDSMLHPVERPLSFGTWFQHFEHAIEVAGIDHVAIGSDRIFFPTWSAPWTPGAMDWTNWPYWTVGLVCRGFTDKEIEGLIGLNFLRYARQVLDKQPWGPFL